jgi:hypothetical protein
MMSVLAADVSKGLEQPKWQSDLSLVLYPYNLLSELLGLPPIFSVLEIDKDWFEEVREEVDIAALVEDGYVRPTPAQKKFIEDEIARLQLTVPMVLLTHPEEKGGKAGIIGGIGGKHYLVVCKDPDIDTRLRILYHELGHIQHQDGAHSEEISEGKKTIADLTAEHDFVSDIKYIEYYLQLGWKAIPSLQQTRLGKHLYKVMGYGDPKEKMNLEKLLKRYHALWQPPVNAKEREAIAYDRGTERRADLYMLRQLYKQDRLDPILTFIRHYGMTGSTFSRAQPWVIAQGDISHPSDVERALYALGFLVAQGIDVPKVLYEWETKGTCPPIEEEPPAGEALSKAESSTIV